MFRVFVVVCGAVLAYDVVAALVEKVTSIPHVWFGIPHVVMHLALGFVLFRMFGMDGRFFAIIAGSALCEMTIGSWIMEQILRMPIPQTRPSIAAAVLLFSVVFQTVVGMVGAWIAKAVTPRTRSVTGA